MKTKILVNRKTIRKIEIDTHIEVKLTFKEIILELFPDVEKEYSYPIGDGMMQYRRRFLNNVPELLLELCKKHSKEISFEINCSRDEIVCKDIEANTKYTYDYITDIDVNCMFCGKTSKFNELEDNIDDDYFETNICPHCKESSCVDVEYEHITDNQIDKMILKNQITIK